MSDELITKIRFLAKAGLGETDEFITQTALVDILTAIESYEGDEVDRLGDGRDEDDVATLDPSVVRNGQHCCESIFDRHLGERD